MSRVVALWPAAHPWLRANCVAPARVSVALLVLKITSAGALSAVFFSSGSPAPGADPECFPKKGGAEQIIQTFAVGVFTAILGDVIISILFALQIKRVVFSETEWTEEQKRRQHLQWNVWTSIFWTAFFLYGGFCQLYICLFLANVTGADAASWLQSMGVSLLEGLLLKSFITAIVLATVATLVLCCKPQLNHKIKAKWIKDGEEEGGEDGGADGHSKDGKNGKGGVDESKRKPTEPMDMEVCSLGSEAHVDIPDDPKRKDGFAGVLPGAVMASSEA